MAHQNKYLERKNEIDKSLDEIQHSEMTQNESKEVRYTSGLLSVAFYLSTIYLVLFISLFALSDIGWGFVVLIFLGPNLLSLAIGAFLLRLGMKRRNKPCSMRVLDSICCLSSWLLIQTGKFFELHR